MAMNIRQSDIMMFITDIFNKNSLEIPFKQGFYSASGQDDFDVSWYKPRLDEKGLFDIEDTFDSETYIKNKKRFVVLSTDVSSGDYTGLPNVQMVSFTASVEVMVYADDPLILLATKMALEETRDNFVGARFLYTVQEQLEDSVEDSTLKIVTNAHGVDYGSEIIAKGRKFLLMTFNIDLTISKNIDFGNQVEFKFSKFDEITNDFGTTYDVIPLIASWGVSQDIEPAQMLNSFSLTTQNKAREIHNYIKSRGFGMIFTFLLNTSSPVLKDLFKQTFDIPALPPQYKIEMKMLVEDDGEWEYDNDLSFMRKVVYGEAEVGDVVRGEPIVFAIGFVVSAK